MAPASLAAYVAKVGLAGRNLDEKRMLLEKSCAASPDDGRPIVHDAIIDDDQHAGRGSHRLRLPGADCRAWMADAGFRDSYVEHLAGPDSMVVRIKYPRDDDASAGSCINLGARSNLAP